MPSKKSKQELGKLEGAHEVLTLVALVPEVGEVLHSDRAVDHREEVPLEDVVEGEVHNGVLFSFFRTDIDL